MNSPDNSVLRIGALRVDPALDEIRMDGTTIKLEPRTMRLLVCLAGHAGQVVSVEQLLDEVWNDVVVNPDSVYQAVAMLRRVLHDDAKNPTYIANVLRRGYRLVAPVAPWVDALAVLGVDSSATTFTAITAPYAAAAIGAPFRIHRPTQRTVVEHPPIAASTTIGDKSIAVLAFIDMSEKKDQEYFSDGLSEELLTRQLHKKGRIDTKELVFPSRADDLP
jgi:transcriptional activator of cad operon